MNCIVVSDHMIILMSMDIMYLGVCLRYCSWITAACMFFLQNIHAIRVLNV